MKGRTYRYFDDALFDFGYGLSYTTFVVGEVLEKKDSFKLPTFHFNLEIPVSNIGDCDGTEVIQLYVSDQNGHVDMPVKELRGFQKVTLQPGESRDVTITIGGRAFQYWDESRGDWTASLGKRTMLVGTASDNLPLKAAFTVR
jgi:beta-glucosidase